MPEKAISFEKLSNLLLLVYQPHDGLDWIREKLKQKKTFSIRQTFYFSSEDILKEEQGENPEDDFYFLTELIFGELYNGEYYRIKKTALNIEYDLFFQKDLFLDESTFVAHRNISIFRRIFQLVSKDIYIGGSKENLPLKDFEQLLKIFPNSTEMDKYAKFRIDGILRQYFNTGTDHIENYEKYINKKQQKFFQKKNLPLLSDKFKPYETIKYKTILEHLKSMLEKSDTFSELRWQREIAHIITLLFPKYIRVFNQITIPDSQTNKKKEIDQILVDTNGNIDIIEIKKPFEASLVTSGLYRNNHIPLRELSGSIMQIEKYIFHLNRWGAAGEKKLTEKFKKKLPSDLNIKIINPSGIVIMGRETGLSEEQLNDLEVIKRKYKNVVDIISYDDLIKRLERTIESLQTQSEEPTQGA